jgi:hypothetical protein
MLYRPKLSIWQRLCLKVQLNVNLTLINKTKKCSLPFRLQTKIFTHFSLVLHMSPYFYHPNKISLKGKIFLVCKVSKCIRVYFNMCNVLWVCTSTHTHTHTRTHILYVSEGQLSFGRHKRWLYDSVKGSIGKYAWDVDWIYLIRDKTRQQALLNTVMKPGSMKRGVSWLASQVATFKRLGPKKLSSV